MKKLFIAVIGAQVLSCGAAHAAELPAGVVEAGAITYGVAASYPPFEFQDEGELKGFDIDLINAMAAKLDAKAVPMNMTFNGLIPALTGGRIDVINSSMYINPAREEQVDFVPYLKIGNRIVVQTGNPSNITGRDDTLCGKTVAVVVGAIEEIQARADDQRCKDGSLEGITIRSFPAGPDSYTNLQQGRVDYIYNSTPGVLELQSKVPGAFEAQGEEFDSDTYVGLATRKGDKELQDAVSAALKEVSDDGTYTALIEKWKLPATVSIFK